MPRNLFRAVLIMTAVAAAAPPALLHAQQSDSTRAERDRQKEIAKELAKERAERDRERQRELRDRERDRQQAARARARDAARRTSGADADWADNDDDERGRITTKLDTTVTFGANGVVDLSLMSGEIVVTAGPRGQAHVRATSEGGALRFEHGTDRLSLDVEGRRNRGDSHFEVSVPEGTRVLMRSISGDLKAHGVKGELEARSTSGDVDVSDAVRSITIETISGDVTAARLAGDVHGSSVSGDVALDGVTGDVDYGSVSGDISLTNARSRSVHLGAVSGDLTFQGGLDPAGRYEFGTHSGEVSLRLPADASATVSVQSFSGEVESDFPLTLQASSGVRRPGQKMEFTLGRGGPRVSAETFSGNITLERGTGRGSN